MTFLKLRSHACNAKAIVRFRLNNHQKIMTQLDKIVMFLSFLRALTVDAFGARLFSHLFLILDYFGTPIWRYFGIKVMNT